MGKRGPKPGSGGRPRKAISEKLVEGNPGKRPLMILKNIPELEGAEMPPPREYLSDTRHGLPPIARAGSLCKRDSPLSKHINCRNQGCPTKRRSKIKLG